MIELTLYGQMYGRPIVRMSVWPFTSTPCWAQTLAVVTAWTASTSPAWTELSAWGDRIEWKMRRAAGAGVWASAAELAAKVARSRNDHSHSRFCKKANDSGKVSLLSVVSIWNTVTP